MEMSRKRIEVVVKSCNTNVVHTSQQQHRLLCMEILTIIWKELCAISIFKQYCNNQDYSKQVLLVMCTGLSALGDITSNSLGDFEVLPWNNI
jgi:hypothetical protein